MTSYATGTHGKSDNRRNDALVFESPSGGSQLKTTTSADGVGAAPADFLIDGMSAPTPLDSEKTSADSEKTSADPAKIGTEANARPEAANDDSPFDIALHDYINESASDDDYELARQFNEYFKKTQKRLSASSSETTGGPSESVETEAGTKPVPAAKIKQKVLNIVEKQYGTLSLKFIAPLLYPLVEEFGITIPRLFESLFKTQYRDNKHKFGLPATLAKYDDELKAANGDKLRALQNLTVFKQSFRPKYVPPFEIIDDSGKCNYNCFW